MKWSDNSRYILCTRAAGWVLGAKKKNEERGEKNRLTSLPLDYVKLIINTDDMWEFYYIETYSNYLSLDAPDAWLAQCAVGIGLEENIVNLMGYVSY